jgi:GT2 family glycosyltransferase
MHSGIPQVSAVVSNLNGERYLARLLDTLAAQKGVVTEIIVVDRHSADKSGEILQRYPAVRVVREPPESGLVSGYAAGASHASHPLLFFCNEDLYLGQDCLFDLASHIDLKRRIAAADPWQWTYDGSTWIHGGVRFRPSAWDFNSPLPFRSQNPVARLVDGECIPFGCAGAVMVHASVYDEIGGWDTSFFLDDEDVDLFLRAWQRDWTCVTVPSARVFHAVGASNENVVGTRPQPVSQRRYISNRSNVTVVALKYFSPAVATLGLVMWVTTLLKDVVLFRLRMVWLDLLVLREITRRLPAVLAFRRRNRTWNRAKPGERFFLHPEFAEDRG